MNSLHLTLKARLFSPSDASPYLLFYLLNDDFWLASSKPKALIYLKQYIPI
jgi:hypothetical protein